MKTSETQPLPTEGEGDIMREVVDLAVARKAKGIALYGRSLQAFNGRDAEMDLAEELVDATAYALQSRRQRMKLEARVAALEGVLREAQWHLDNSDATAAGDVLTEAITPPTVPPTPEVKP